MTILKNVIQIEKLPDARKIHADICKKCKKV